MAENSVWFIHPFFRSSSGVVVIGQVGIFAGLPFGSDRTTLEELGITVNTNRPDKIAAFVAHYPGTLLGQDYTVLEPLYTDRGTTRDGANAEPTASREWIIYPSELTLAQAESLISPRKV